jgi:hypothetical protein
VNTAAVIGDAMTDYLLAAGTNKAPATRAPAHMAAWMRSRGYQVVRSPACGPAGGPADPGDPLQIARLAATIDWPAGIDAADRRAIVRQVLLTATTGACVVSDVRQVA